MYKGTEPPKNYNELTLFQKGAYWIGALAQYEHSAIYDKTGNYWEVMMYVPITVFEDENITLSLQYGNEFVLNYKNGAIGLEIGSDWVLISMHGSFNDDKYKNLRVGDKLGIKNYEGMYLIDYIRCKGFPVDAEFWTDWESEDDFVQNILQS